MKTKVFIAIILCAFGIESLAQAPFNPNATIAKTKMGGVGFQLGFARDLLRERKGDNETKKFPYLTALNGIKAGVVYDATIIKGFGVSMALNYTIAGAQDRSWRKQYDNQIGAYPQVKDSYLFQSVELPIDWQYKFEIAKETYLILYSGPTIQYNFYLKQTQHYKATATTEVQKNHFNHYEIDADKDGTNDYTQLNITWGIGAGFQYQRYFLRGGYDFGIYSPYKDRFIDDKGKYNDGRLDQWSLKIGMYFWEF